MSWRLLPFLFLTLGTFSTPAVAGRVDPGRLESEIGRRSNRVDSFRTIREEAERLGVRVWLFGGTAAGYGHYVKWDLEREGGGTRYQPGRFDYDFTSIYHSSQDADLVIDGTAEQAHVLQTKLAGKLPFLQGSKTAWEVRLLGSQIGDKQALLDNPDFLNQHTDSNSTGMIELTRPSSGEPRVRDLKDWNGWKAGKASRFLTDMAKGEIRYLHSPTHAETTRFREGKNPPILSVIRVLTKAFQYELKLPPSDLQRLREIVSSFDPAAPLSSYVRDWIEKNARKLVTNAVNVEYAFRTLDEIGLRSRLVALGNPQAEGSMAWWLSRRPLASYPVGTGTGRTAREIFAERGLPIEGPDAMLVSHNTRNYIAYESITRSGTGEANALTSRTDVVGEAAAFGEGFYTAIGRIAPVQGGQDLRILLRLDPEAREGTDFRIVATNYCIVLNKNAIRVVPESLNLDPWSFFRLLADSPEISPEDRGILHRLGLRNNARMSALSPAEKSRIAELVGEVIDRPHPSQAVLRAWFGTALSLEYPELAIRLTAKPDLSEFIRYVLSEPIWRKHYPDPFGFLENRALSREAEVAVIEAILGKADSRAVDPKALQWLQARLGTGDYRLNTALAAHVLGNEAWTSRPEAMGWLTQMISEGAQMDILRPLFTDARWAARPDSELLIQALLGKLEWGEEAVILLAKDPAWARNPHVLKVMRENLSDYSSTVRKALTAHDWQDNPAGDQLFRVLGISRKRPARGPLSDQVTERIPQVEELAWLRQEAKRMGIRAWLMGGGAASLGHYVKNDSGQTSHDLFKILHPGQDLDILIDGDADQARLLQRSLELRFPFGDRSSWEVRPLRHSIDEKDTVLSHDFQKQSSDTLSLGAIEITEPPNGEPVVRDLNDWDSRKPSRFATDLEKGQIHYLRSPEHRTTARFRAGNNPELFSAIRYLSKAFEFGLDIPPEDEPKLREVIRHFRSQELRSSDYARRWFNANAPKLYTRSTDVERSQRVLRGLGLLDLLVAQGGDSKAGSVAAIFSREPLASHPVGLDPKTGLPGRGRTAGELGIRQVTHETDLVAARSIAASPDGAPNAFISSGGVGESAMYGHGFYTVNGQTGAGNGGQGLQLLFDVDPMAREGVDFLLASNLAHGPVPDHAFIRWLNKRALKWIPQPLEEIPIVRFLEEKAQGKYHHRSDALFIQMMSRKTRRGFSSLSEVDQSQLVALAERNAQKIWPDEDFFKIWFSIPESTDHPQVAERLISTSGPERALGLLMPERLWRERHPELIDRLLGEFEAGEKRTLALPILRGLAYPHWTDRADLLQRIVAMPTIGAHEDVVREVLSQPHWAASPELRRLCGGEPTDECLRKSYENRRRLKRPCAKRWAKLAAARP